jgi:hypothetical protein
MSKEQITSMHDSNLPKDDTNESAECSLELQSEMDRILQSCPIAGEGVNPWLFTAALKLHLLKIEPDEIEELLTQATWNCGRAIKPDEIERAVRNAHPDKLKDRPWRRKWPLRNYEQIEAIGLRRLGVTDLQRQSPVQLQPEDNHAEEIIDALFPGNPLICAGLQSEKFILTRPRSEWRGFLSRQQFIVPSPMVKRKGLTQDGKLSFRTLENVGPRKFLVVEFDFVATSDVGFSTPMAPVLERLKEQGVTTLDLCAAIHAELAKVRPLALVVHSGKKSLHGWYPCAGGSEEETMHRFMRFAVSLGADPATWTPVQWVRMPDGIRDNAERQRILYFNPAVVNGGAK